MTSLLTDFRGGPNRGFDVIYMDPPYNTGSDVFSFNDDYNLSGSEVRNLRKTVGRPEELVSLDDPTRHTKWINHMAPRLWAARKLLKLSGVIIVSVDEHELPRLWLLMEEIFSPANRIATLIWGRSRKNDAAYISEGHEYMLIWARSRQELDSKRRHMGTTDSWLKVLGKWRQPKLGVDSILTAYAEAKAKHGDDVPKIQEEMNTFFTKLPQDHPARKSRYKKVNKWGMHRDDGNLTWPGGGGPKYDVIHPVTQKPCRIPASGWRYKEEALEKLINPSSGERDRIAFKKSHQSSPGYIEYLDEVVKEVRTSIIQQTGQRATEMVNAILGKGVFKSPKDHEMLAELFNLVTWRDKGATILDPYAGSGTTGHAVISMNAEDEGSRRFVLIDSGDPRKDAPVSQTKFTSKITAERVRRVITGRWADEGNHPSHDTGFHFFHAKEAITKAAIMESTREALSDIILQVVEDDSNRLDYRIKGFKHLIGKTKSGYGIALVWHSFKNGRSDQVLNQKILDLALDEAISADCTFPIHIYASGNTAPISEDLYRFHQIPHSILARLGIIDETEEA
jgi:adenine-specific DNA-methyltransferase